MGKVGIYLYSLEAALNALEILSGKKYVPQTQKMKWICIDAIIHFNNDSDLVILEL